MAEASPHTPSHEVVSHSAPTDTVQDTISLTALITSTHVATGIKSNLLLMTCQVRVEAQDGSTMEARAIRTFSSKLTPPSVQIWA